MLPNESAVLERYGISTEDIDFCALYVAGDSDMPLLYFVEDSVTSATKTDREVLEGLVKRRVTQLQEFLRTTAP